LQHSPSPVAGSANLRSILFIIGAGMCFACNDICAKLAVRTLPTPEVMVIRGIGAATIALLLVIAVHGAAALGTLRNRNVMLRSFIEALVGAGLITCFAFMPIASVNAILQIGPFFAMLVGVFLFRESVGWRRWMAAGVAFTGVLCVIQPAGDRFTFASVLVLLLAILMVLRDIQSRIIGLRAPPFVVALGTALAGITLALILSPLMQPFGLRAWGPWLMPDAFTLTVTLLASVFLVGAHALSFLAFRGGDMSVVAPFRYVYLCWAVLGGAIVFGDYPDALSLTGMALVVAAGLYLLHRERMRAKTDTEAPI
jgi:drug/metabolite transporter (DMT)-like permease